MMSGDLQRYLKDPSSLQQANLSDLEKLAIEFPYFAIAQILLAKKYQLENHPATTKQLNKAALAINDRHLLLNFLNGSVARDFKKSIIPEKDFAEKAAELSEVLSSNEELHEMLKSIHERKQALLESENKAHENGEQAGEESEFEMEQRLISMVSASQTEQSLLEVDEESSEHQMKESIESEAISSIESEMMEQLSYEEQEDLLVLNEVAGGGAEFLPTEFTQEESREEDFIIDQDSELQSLGVIEEEFIARENEFEEQEKEAEKISVLESGGTTETFESELIEADVSDAEIESESVLEEELIRHEAPHIKNDNGSNVVFSEAEQLISENENQPEPFPESTSIHNTMELNQEISGQESSESFRITETVNSPGEFLPEKSYRFSQWLQFFRLNQPPPKIQKEVIKSKKEAESETEAEDRFSGNTMQQELESIDRIVSSIHAVPDSNDKVISAEEMAKKSSEMDSEIVSETLANIYEEQGHYDKAIRMYVKLSLRFPDKVSFFAARIKELKSKK